MPQLIRLVLLHGAIGFGIAAVFVALLVGTDTNGIATLLHNAESHPLPVLLLWFLCGLTFGSVQIGAAIMFLGEDDDEDGPGGGTLIPIPVRRR